jgi:hypothetical protein
MNVRGGDRLTDLARVPPRVIPKARVSVLPLLLGLVFFSLAAPLLLVDSPPALDYANHAARLWLIAGGANIEPLNHMFVIDWSRTSTNIGIDLMAATFGGVLGKTNVAPLCMALAIMLPCLGTFLLNRRIFGGLHWWQLAFTFPAFSKTVLAGFMNFNISIGLAMVSASLDEPLERRGPIVAFAGRALLTVLILVFHPFGVVGYAALLMGLAIGRDLSPLLTWVGFKSRIAPVIIAVLPVLVPVILVEVLAPHPPLDVSAAAIGWERFSLSHLVALMLTGFHAYLDAFDILTAAFVVVIAGAALLLRKAQVHGGVLLAGLSFLALAPFVPTQVGLAFWVDYRLPTLAVFMLLASVRPDFEMARRTQTALVAGLVVLGLARTAVVGAAWVSAQGDIRSIRQALNAMPEGASVLSLTNEPTEADRAKAPFGRYIGDHPMFWGWGTLAVPQRHAFVPNLWTIAGQQPLRVLDPWTELHAPFSGPPARVVDLNAPSYPIARRYLTRWKRFDYILLLNADLPDKDGGQLSPADVDLVADQGFAILYRIKHVASETPPPGA